MTVENKGSQKDRGKGLGNYGNSRKGRSKSKLGKIECWNCGKKGHLKKDYSVGMFTGSLQAGVLVIDGKIRVCSDGKTRTT